MSRDLMRILTWLTKPQALSNAHRLKTNRVPTRQGLRIAIDRVRWSSPDDRTSPVDRSRENMTVIQASTRIKRKTEVSQAPSGPTDSESFAARGIILSRTRDTADRSIRICVGAAAGRH